MRATGETGFWPFLLSFGSHWLTLMSGGLSVPLTIAAVFVKSPTYKIALVTLAVVAFMGSSYAVWRNERRRAVEAERRLAAGAEAQAELAKAQHDLLKRAEDEEQGHQRWVEGVLAQLRTPGSELVHVLPGDRLHAEWALARGFVESRSTSQGTALVLPLAERSQIPGSPEAKMLEARRTILTYCAEHPGAWCTWDRHTAAMMEPGAWQTFSAAAEQLENEGLATTRATIGAVGIRLTNDGIAAARRGAF